jgi:UDP-N-acetylmuramyl pentapeptide phosphotransferase/UDP-N-acetylglucosamine-1-phosphate transferase
VGAGQGPGVAGYLIVIGAAFAVSFLSMPVLKRLAWRVGAIDRPDPRRVHTQPTPVFAGPGILGGLLCGLLVAWLSGEFSEVFRTITPPLGVALAATAIYGVGQVDDLRELSPPAKMAGIVLAGSILSLAGVSIIFFRIPFLGLYALSPDLSALITVVWVAGMANAINFIDGLDGLAGGVVAIAAGSFILYAEHLDDLGAIDQANIGPLVAAAVLGACLGYLPWNFHPAKIFMGDAGALTLGLSMAAVTIAVGGNSDVQVTGQTAVPAAADPRRAAAGHRLGDPAPGQEPVGRGDRRQGAPAPPAHAARPRAAAQRADPVGVDRAAVRRRAVPDVHRPGRCADPRRGGGARRAALHAVRARGAVRPAGERHRAARTSGTPGTPGTPGAGLAGAAAGARDPALSPAFPPPKMPPGRDLRGRERVWVGAEVRARARVLPPAGSEGAATSTSRQRNRVLRPCYPPAASGDPAICRIAVWFR